MSGYDTLFTLDVLHPYFSDAARLRLRFQPDAATRAWLERTGCIVRTSSNQLRVHYETARDGPRREVADGDGPVDLRFAVRAVDPRFGQYTDGLPPMSEPPLTLWGGDAAKDGDGWRMKPSAKRVLVWPEGRRPDFVVALPVDTKAIDARRAYNVPLQSRATLWKYLLLGDWNGSLPQVVDPDKAMRFEPGPDEVLADGRTAKVIRAADPIPLAERFDQRFELHAGGKPGRVIVKRLPVPGAANLSRDPAGASFISEIFVQR